MKTCGKCGATKELTEFYKGKGYKDGYRGQCKECFCAATNQYCKTNTSRRSIWKRNQRLADPEKQRAKEREWYANLDPEKLEEQRRKHREWIKNNPDKNRMYANNRKASELQATPKWASKRYTALWYKAAVMEQERTGRKIHVDHIVPLQGKLVCGLHCEDNMQLLFAEDNQAKYNRH